MSLKYYIVKASLHDNQKYYYLFHAIVGGYICGIFRDITRIYFNIKFCSLRILYCNAIFSPGMHRAADKRSSQYVQYGYSYVRISISH